MKKFYVGKGSADIVKSGCQLNLSQKNEKNDYLMEKNE